MEDYADLIKAVENLIEELRPRRKNPSKLDISLNLLKEIKFNAMGNKEFRERTYPELEQLLDKLYAEVNA